MNRILVLEIESLITLCRVEGYIINVEKRPYTDQFLNWITKHFNIGIWSTLEDSVLENILTYLFPDKKELVFIWGRSLCDHQDSSNSPHGEILVKDFKKMWNMIFIPSDSFLMIDVKDNKVRNIDNLLQVEPWRGSEKDSELINIKKKLTRLAKISKMILEKKKII